MTGHKNTVKSHTFLNKNFRKKKLLLSEVCHLYEIAARRHNFAEKKGELILPILELKTFKGKKKLKTAVR